MKITLFIHRRDLRIDDNAALYKALKSGNPVQPVFILDRTILDHLNMNDQRVLFIHQEITRLKREYQQLGSDLWVFYGTPKSVLSELIVQYEIAEVFVNRDYEPNALERDKQLFDLFSKNDIAFHGAKDHVIFEKNEVLKPDGKPYTVFTPYMRTWKNKFEAFYSKPYPTKKYVGSLNKQEPMDLISLEEMGFSNEQIHDFPPFQVPDSILNNYQDTRDIPSINGTSRLSLHLRFGTISIRALVNQAMQCNEKYLNELIWRDFYQVILFHFPHSVNGSFRKEYDRIEWENNEVDFEAWCQGKTGYPMVDAGMRELNATGHMHNRVRMVVASFLTKHLLIDWRWGERYFAEKLLDFELASNIGGWQWAAGSGCDAAPYFRVFNPTSQQQKFDPKFIYIKRWIPEFGTDAYPKPIVDHAFARVRVLERYKKALKPD